MNQDDPFSPNIDTTIIMPSPGGKITPGQLNNNSFKPDSTSTRELYNENEEDLREFLAAKTGLNPLISAANPLLNSILQFANTPSYPNPTGLHDILIRQIQTFEHQAKKNGVAPEKIIAARYALCTLIDECISSTPWGSNEWGKNSLLIFFHNEGFGGEKFFQLLDRLIENPNNNIDILELLYICLALGFKGRYHLMTSGNKQLDEIRERLAQIISRTKNVYEQDLSPQWKTTPVKRTKFFLYLPIWAIVTLCGAILIGTYLSYNSLLNNLSNKVFDQILAIQTKHAIPKQTIPLVDNDTLAEFLKKEIEEGLVSVHNSNERSTITLLGDGIFPPGSISISKRYEMILSRIAQELNQLSGQIKILGHTDNQPIRSVRFPSNWHLSKERANSVKQFLITKGISPNRLSAEGRSDTQPIASNNSVEGRARNRRVEIILHRTY